MAKSKDVSKQYTSTQTYFDKKGVRYRPGTVFTLPAGVRPGKTMTEFKGGVEKGDEQSPETLSELAKAEAKAQGNALV